MLRNAFPAALVVSIGLLSGFEACALCLRSPHSILQIADIVGQLVDTCNRQAIPLAKKVEDCLKFGTVVDVPLRCSDRISGIFLSNRSTIVRVCLSLPNTRQSD